MIHISSDAAVDGLFESAGFLLKPYTGRLFTYGPYGFDGKISPESNLRFDKSLRGQNPEWGLRDVEELKKKAAANRLTLKKVHAMPANNHMLVFEKEAPSLTISACSGVSWH
ncbi:hypothetical protein AAVH_08230 [Aphelenchoides avenae]|nr:hypothetical protein AAVH_08230 [Aphelenchus avenae]